MRYRAYPVNLFYVATIGAFASSLHGLKHATGLRLEPACAAAGLTPREPSALLPYMRLRQTLWLLLFFLYPCPLLYPAVFLHWDVAMLLGWPGLTLGREKLQGIDYLEAAVAGRDYFVH